MRPANTFSIIQLSNSRIPAHTSNQSLPPGNHSEHFKKQRLIYSCFRIIIPSLTVEKRKNRCIPCICWATAIFIVVTEYSNLFFSFTFFLNISHFTFGYELIIRSKATDFMKIICDDFSLV